MRTIILAMLLATIAACQVEQYEPINIAVYPSVKRCMIKETVMECEKLPGYLRDLLKAGADREITVSYAGSETVEKGDTSVDQIADLIKASGYKNVRAIRYDMK